MTEDLRRQASELYRERSQNGEIPTSDSLSMKKIVYVSLGLLIGLAIVIQLFGGFRPRPNPIAAATAPRSIVKEALPPELMEPEKTTKPDAAAAAAAAPEAVKPDEPFPAPATPALPPPLVESKRPTAKAASTALPAQGPPLQKKEREPVTLGARISGEKNLEKPESSATPPKPPEITPLEIARRELARDIILEKSPALSKIMIASQEDLVYQGWQARPDGADFYQVTFSFLEKSSNSPIQYVWRVNLTAKSITPLSYYARRLL